ncbi:MULTISPECIES: DUF3969 family protein [Acinetobacter]|uniref:DUF3969 family protein n=2 Tax=Acinetobacter seifertii TaxID=1530123 RepID=A0A7H2QII1_9GAMM|nr:MULTISPECIES: DUF3969 family protein [Acinetobacter]ONN51749.1 hypothetical protein AC056_02470 [Acinetobacter genomosp. 33YU]QNX04362.1 DUF3969 family protein [Acinetobacter seifertii]QNX14914.1 DUF3969 family protein [Acinetobacter seifertii]
MNKSGKTDLEKLILLVNLGILHSLKNNYIDINEAEHFLYTPYMLKLLKENNCSMDLINIIHRGTELEDLEGFNIDFKDEVEKMFKESEGMIKKLPVTSFEFEKWYDQKLFDKYD